MIGQTDWTPASLRRHVNNVGFGVSLAILAGIAVVSYRSVEGFKERARLVEHTQEVLRETDAVFSNLKDAETGVRGYVISGEDSFLAPYRQSLSSIPVRLRRLKELIGDNPDQQKRIHILAELTKKRLDEAAHVLQLSADSSRTLPGPLKRDIGAGKMLMDDIRALVADVRHREEMLLKLRADESRRSAEQTIAVIVAGNLAGISILILAFVLLRREIAERTRTQREAENLAAEIEDLYNRAPCGYHSVNKDGVFVRMNDTELAWLGYRREEVIGKLKFIDLIPAENKQLVRETFPGFMEDGEVNNLEFTLIRKNGATFPVSVSATALRDKDGNYVMSRTTVFDVSALKVAENRIQETNSFLDAVVENIPSMVFVKEAGNLRFVRINKAEEELLGIPREALIGKSDHDLFPREQADFFTGKDREVLASGDVTDIAEEELSTPHGTRILHTRKIGLFDKKGQPQYLLGISEDITERKRTAEAIRALNVNLEVRADQLEAANKELESFSYSVSHDLRSPLRAIDGFSRILEDDYGDKLDEEARRLLTVVRTNSQKMGQLIDDLLALSRLGRKPLTASRLDMRALALEALSEVLAGARHSSNVVVGNLPAAWGDQVLLKQVWVNLIANAIKYSSTKEKAKIEIGGAMENDQSGSRSTYFVRDNGVGFDMRYYDKLFGAFQRLHGVAEFPGTGVGLAIVQRAVTRLGGRVWAEAKVGEGATFFFSLPEKEHDDRTGTS